MRARVRCVRTNDSPPIAIDRGKTERYAIMLHRGARARVRLDTKNNDHTASTVLHNACTG